MIMPTTPAETTPIHRSQCFKPCKRSTHGAPRKIQRKLGKKVVHDVRPAPRIPDIQGDKEPGWCQAPKNPMNCRTMINGPGVLSARAIPAIISELETQ